MTVSIVPLQAQHRQPLHQAIVATRAFFDDEVEVAMELIDCGIAQRDDYRFQVAEVDGVAVGYSCYGLVPLTDASYDLYWIVVDPRCQGQGVGRLLIQATEQAVRDLGGRMLLAETASKPEYAATRAFYDGVGYVEVARVPDFYRLGDDKIIYWKRF